DLDYHPVFTIYRELCTKYANAKGTRIGETQNVTDLLENKLKQQIALWEGKIRSVYAEGTPKEVAYFPNKRKPFFHGRYITRIGAIGVLATRLARDSSAILTAYAPT